ncbi:hypothetical protein [Dethiosulfatarculus sandiegensis]|uniref:Lipoprotein n=1 Tax=Dethiosulfatarculus sandiegensis TaxID=1429043 RepID=A0A0D2HWK5_9BACT|nr:hypothetical protein [Dethiosulfatarculus sandiegensis]KIX14758.1 hypothetical protein X474_06345 [Dethiosulfatarculus sandiegensis]
MDFYIPVRGQKRIFRSIACLILGSLLLFGCTTNLQVDPITPPNHKNATGLVYYLPYTNYEIVITHELEKCDCLKNDGQYVRIDEKYVPDIGYKTTAAVKTLYFQDLENAYVIDYTKLGAESKTSSISVELYDNGTLKSINAQVDDKTQEIATGIAESVAKIAGAFMGVQIPSIQKGKRLSTKDAIQLCNWQTLNALKAYKKTTQTIKDLNKAIEGLKEELLKEKAKEKPDQAKIDLLKGQIKKASEELGTQQKILAKITPLLTHAKVYQFSPGFDVEKRSKSLSGQDARDKWLNKDTLENSKIAKSLKGIFDTDTAVLLPPKSKKPQKDPASSTPPIQVESAINQTDTGSPTGLAYRTPVKGVLLVCNRTKCLNNDGELAALFNEIIHEEATGISQFGQVAYLPLENTPFLDNNIAVQFARDGTVTQFKYGENASAEEMVKLLQTTTDLGVGLYSAKQGVKAQKAKLSAETSKEQFQEEQWKIKLELLKKCRQAQDRGEPLSDECKALLSGGGESEN